MFRGASFSKVPRECHVTSLIYWFSLRLLPTNWFSWSQGWRRVESERHSLALRQENTRAGALDCHKKTAKITQLFCNCNVTRSPCLSIVRRQFTHRACWAWTGIRLVYCAKGLQLYLVSNHKEKIFWRMHSSNGGDPLVFYQGVIGKDDRAGSCQHKLPTQNEVLIISRGASKWRQMLKMINYGIPEAGVRLRYQCGPRSCSL